MSEYLNEIANAVQSSNVKIKKEHKLRCRYSWKHKRWFIVFETDKNSGWPYCGVTREPYWRPD